MKRQPFLLILLLFWGCDSSLEISPIPEIELISVTPETVTAFEDEIVFELNYTDGDGDLGTNDDTQRNLFIRDERLQLVHPFRLKQLAPEGAGIPITGAFEVTLPQTIATDSSGSEQVVFSIWVEDRAGNLSR